MIQVDVRRDPEAAGARAADVVAEAIVRAISEGRRFAWALSGGRTPAPMFRRFRDLELPWERVDTWQVDERIAPLHHPDRNRTLQSRELPAAGMDGMRWMPVDDEDLEGAADRYAATLPERFDLVHLGLGDDGHTASLVPGDPVLDVDDHDVALTGAYRERRRMTLTYPGLSRAARVVWLVAGAESGDVLRKLLAGDPSIPATRVPVGEQLVVADAAAAGSGEAEP